MTFPRISTKATNITVTPQLETLLEQKFAPIGKLLGNQSEVQCEIELEKVAEHQSGKIYRVEVNLKAGGKLFRADATEEQIEQAIDEVRDEVRAEILRVNGKRQSLVRRGRQALKNMLRSGK